MKVAVYGRHIYPAQDGRPFDQEAAKFLHGAYTMHTGHIYSWITTVVEDEETKRVYGTAPWFWRLKRAKRHLEDGHKAMREALHDASDVT